MSDAAGSLSASGVARNQPSEIQNPTRGHVVVTLGWLPFRFSTLLYRRLDSDLVPDVVAGCRGSRSRRAGRRSRGRGNFEVVEDIRPSTRIILLVNIAISARRRGGIVAKNTAGEQIQFVAHSRGEAWSRDCGAIERAGLGRGQDRAAGDDVGVHSYTA